MSLPSVVRSALSSSAVLGFSGSRSVVPPVLASALAVAAGSSAAVLVGCARGVDSACRGAFPASRLSVFRASSFGSGRGAFAARSAAFVRAVASSGGVLFSFPSGACPVGLLPSSSSSGAFCGAGSGSWASLSLAVGLGVSCFVFLGSVPAPAGWGLVSVGGGWWRSAPAAVQLSLF